MHRHCAFLVPGDWLTPTGGYRYDRQIILGLRAAGWKVRHLRIGGGFPRPTRSELAQADGALAELPEGTLTVIDGLAFGAMPELAARHARRLVLVALVHHPLHLETGLDEERRRQLADSERRALACAAGVIVSSPATSKDVQALGVPRERITVVEPGVLLPRAHARRNARAPSAHGAALRLLCVATLVPRKGHDVLLQALSTLQDRRWTLDCVGSATRDPQTARHLAKLAQTLGLQERVRWHGEVAEPALHACYREADVFVLPSHHEGYGMVIQEALAHGLPVITTTAGALRDTLPPDAGLHVPPGDAPALAEALAALMDSRAERARLSEGARRAKAGLPTWDDAARSFARALGRIAAQGAEAPEGQGQGHVREPRFGDGERSSTSEQPPARAVHAVALVEEPAQGRFDGGWLALREPHDRAARSNAAAMGVVAQAHRAALAHAEARCAGTAAHAGRETRPMPTLRVIDLACGTGANLRLLAPALGGRQEWLVADHDAGLLAAWPQVFSLAGQRGEGRLAQEGQELAWRGEARPGTARAFDVRIRRLRIDLQREFDQIPLGEADLVTASALIDLASAPWIDRLVAACAKARFALLFALTVDGRWTWSPRDHFDGPVHAFFTAHQRRDKGFGPALGAEAAAYACAMAREAGLQVHTARSDWFLEGSRDAEMLGALIEGIAQAAIEQAPANAAAIEGWRVRRQAVLARIRLRVGHAEVLVSCGTVQEPPDSMRGSAPRKSRSHKTSRPSR